MLYTRDIAKANDSEILKVEEYNVYQNKSNKNHRF